MLLLKTFKSVSDSGLLAALDKLHSTESSNSKSGDNLNKYLFDSFLCSILKNSKHLIPRDHQARHQAALRLVQESSLGMDVSHFS